MTQTFGKHILRHPEDWRCVLWIALDFILTAAAWHYALALGPLCSLASTLVLCYFSFAGACITHNSMHCRTFTHPMCETLWRHALSLTYGHPSGTFVPGHNLSHHRFTQTTLDPMRTTKVNYRWHLLNALLFQPTVAADVFKMDIRYLALKYHTRDAYFHTCIQEWVVLGLSQIFLLLLNPFKYMLFLYVPHLFAQWGIVCVNLLQHDGCETDPDKAINGSRNFTGPVVNFLTFANGFHTAHHRFPTVHWSKLQGTHEEFVAHKCHPTLNQKCMARYIWSTFIYPGKRVHYTGDDFTPPPPGPDQDWTAQHAPDGVKLQDYDVTLVDLLRVIPLIPMKLMCLTYSPQFKVD